MYLLSDSFTHRMYLNHKFADWVSVKTDVLHITQKKATVGPDSQCLLVPVQKYRRLGMYMQSNTRP